MISSRALQASPASFPAVFVFGPNQIRWSSKWLQRVAGSSEGKQDVMRIRWEGVWDKEFRDFILFLLQQTTNKRRRTRRLVVVSAATRRGFSAFTPTQPVFYASDSGWNVRQEAATGNFGVNVGVNVMISRVMATRGLVRRRRSDWELPD